MIIPLDDAAFVEAMAHKPEVDMGYLPIRVEDRDRLVALAREAEPYKREHAILMQELVSLRQRLADAEARVREVEEALEASDKSIAPLCEFDVSGICEHHYGGRVNKCLVVEGERLVMRRAALARRTT